MLHNTPGSAKLSSVNTKTKTNTPAEAFRALRLEQGLSIRAAAELVGVTIGSVQQLENGTTNPVNVKAHTIAGLARAYGLHELDVLDLLLGRIDRPKRKREGLALLRSNVAEDAETGCLLWQGGMAGPGYGTLYHKGRHRYAHRLAWELTFGPIPAGMHVLHKCDRPLCVNPDHLFLGTHQENMADRERKRRSARGERHGRAKLSKRQVRAIRREYAAGGVTLRELAEEYGVTPAHISAIGRGKAWAHLK